jgi:hypothetical protein
MKKSLFRHLFSSDKSELGQEVADLHQIGDWFTNKEGLDHHNLLYPDNQNPPELSGPDSPQNSELRGVEALDAFITIGWRYEAGVPLDSDHERFLVELGRNLLKGLNETNKKASTLLSDALGLGERIRGGGAADQFRSQQRNRRLAGYVTLLLLKDPNWSFNDAVEAVAAHERVHSDTVRAAVKGISREDGWTGGLRRRPRGRPRKRRD